MELTFALWFLNALSLCVGKETQNVTDAPTEDSIQGAETCESMESDGDYNLGYAIASVFVVLVVSFLGFMTPLWISDFGDKNGVKLAIVACGCAGTSVIIAVSYHILGDSQELLSSPCLPSGFLDSYPFWGQLFAAVTVLLAILTDYFLRLYLERSKNFMVEFDAGQDSPDDGKSIVGMDVERKTDSDSAGDPSAALVTPTDVYMDSVTKSRSKFQQISGTSSNFVLEALEKEKMKKDASFAWHGGDHTHGDVQGRSEEEVLRLKRGVIAFVEFSVLTHSVPVGLALGLQSGSAFTGLFIAVIFHQLIEGFGVGAATLEGKYNRLIESMLALAFAITCPIGIAIGIILQMTLNTESEGYILTVGICNAIGAGLLIYIGIEHLNTLSSRGQWLRKQNWISQTIGIGSFVAGGAAMFVICKYS